MAVNEPLTRPMEGQEAEWTEPDVLRMRHVARKPKTLESPRLTDTAPPLPGRPTPSGGTYGIAN